MHVKLERKNKNQNKLLIVPLSVIIILSSIYIFNLLSSNYYQLEEKVDFKVYKSQYNKEENQIIVWLDQNGTLPCRMVNVRIHPDKEWSFTDVNPEQFIKLTYPVTLNTTTGIPYLQEIFIEFEYLDENIRKTDDKILWIIIDHNNIL